MRYTQIKLLQKIFCLLSPNNYDINNLWDHRLYLYRYQVLAQVPVLAATLITGLVHFLRSRCLTLPVIFTRIDIPWLATWIFTLTASCGWLPGALQRHIRKTTRRWWVSHLAYAVVRALLEFKCWKTKISGELVIFFVGKWWLHMKTCNNWPRALWKLNRVQ